MNLRKELLAAATLAAFFFSPAAFADSGSGGGGASGGGPATVVDGGDVTQGAKADVACTSDTAVCSVVQMLKRIAQNLSTLNTTAAGSSPVTIVEGGDITEGTRADAACSTDAGTCTVIQMLKRLAANITALNATAAGSSPVTIVEGGDVTEGAKADVACTTDTATCTVIQMLKRIAQNLTTLNTTSASTASTIADGADAAEGAKADLVCGTDTGTCSVLQMLKKIAANLTTLNTTTAGSSATTTADGADVTQGAKADTSCATDGGTCTVVQMLKRIAANLTTLNTTAGASQPTTVVDGGDVTQGAKADASCSTDSGTCSVVQMLKRVAANLTTLNTTAAGPAIINDGGDVTQGAKADAACSTDTGTCTLVQLLKRLAQNLTTLNTTNAGPVNIASAATGGCTGGVILTTTAVTASSLKGSPGTLCELSWLNTTTSSFDIRLVDNAAAPTCSSATGVIANYPVQSNATSPGATIALGPFGKAFAAGIAICISGITGALSNTDTTAPIAGLAVNYSLK